MGDRRAALAPRTAGTEGGRPRIPDRAAVTGIVFVLKSSILTIAVQNYVVDTVRVGVAPRHVCTKDDVVSMTDKHLEILRVGYAGAEETEAIHQHMLTYAILRVVLGCRQRRRDAVRPNIC